MNDEQTITCPYCRKKFPAIYLIRQPFTPDLSTISRYTLSYAEFDAWLEPVNSPNGFSIEIHMCTHCFRQSVFLDGGAGNFENIEPRYLYPADTSYKTFDEKIKIPSSILQDYKEACLISKLSPKASATLSRRCLQGMIRDFHKVTKDTLGQEINYIKDNISPEIYNALDNLRLIGNLGAHPEKDINLIIDIEPDEALVLIILLEILFDEWYVSRYNRKLHLDRLSEISYTQKAKRQEPKI